MQKALPLVSPYLHTFADQLSLALCTVTSAREYKIRDHLSLDQKRALVYLQENSEPKCIINMPAKSGKSIVALLYYTYLQEKGEKVQLCIHGKEAQYKKACQRLQLPTDTYASLLHLAATKAPVKEEKLTFILDASYVNTQHREKQVAQLLQDLALRTKHLRVVILQGEDYFLPGGHHFNTHFPLDDTIPTLLRIVSTEPGQLFSLTESTGLLPAFKEALRNAARDFATSDVFYGEKEHVRAVLSTIGLWAAPPVVFAFHRQNKQLEGYCFQHNITFIDIASDEVAFYKALLSTPRSSVKNVILVADEKLYTSNFGSYRMYLRARLLLDLLRQRSLQERRITITVIINECVGEGLSFALSLLMPRQLRSAINTRNKSRHLFYNKDQPLLAAGTRTSFTDLFEQVYRHRFYQHKIDRKCRFTLAKKAFFYTHGSLLALVQPFFLRQRKDERAGKGLLTRVPKKRYVVQPSTLSDRELQDKRVVLDKKRKASVELARPEKRARTEVDLVEKKETVSTNCTLAMGCPNNSIEKQSSNSTETDYTLTDEELSLYPPIDTCLNQDLFSQLWVSDYSFSTFLEQEGQLNTFTSMLQ